MSSVLSNRGERNMFAVSKDVWFLFAFFFALKSAAFKTCLPWLHSNKQAYIVCKVMDISTRPCT